MAAEPQFMKLYVSLFGLVGIGGAIGWWLDRCETLRMTHYRDKSALFGKELKPGEPPSWP